MHAARCLGHGCQLVRCNLFQTSHMTVTQLNELLTVALGIDEGARIPTLHIIELTEARAGKAMAM